MEPTPTVPTGKIDRPGEQVRTPPPVTVLYVDDEPHNTDLFALHFSAQYHVVTAGNAEEGLAVLDELDVGVVVSDERMPGISGVEFLTRVRDVAPLATRMVISAYKDAPLLLRAIQQGQVHDYMTKPWTVSVLVERVGRAVDQYLRRRELYDAAADRDVLQEDVLGRYDPGRIVGGQTGLRPVMAVVDKVARAATTVLLRGESGTGKELLARAIHDRSPRRHRAMIAVNCAALPANLVESELFGHERGAFTGATGRRVGRFEQAHRGTVFLDEVGDLPPEVQVKLLRVLQEEEVERVGGSAAIPVDVRVIAATHRDLEVLVESGEFREDLFYRLNVVPIWVPALRERRQDIPELVRYFLARYGAKAGTRPTISPAAMEALLDHPWPGNVRELENIVERAVVLADGPELDVRAFSFDLRARGLRTPRPAAPFEAAPAAGLMAEPRRSLRDQLRDQSRAELEDALRAAGGNVSEAARRLGLPRTTFFSRAQRFGLV